MGFRGYCLPVRSTVSTSDSMSHFHLLISLQLIAQPYLRLARVQLTPASPPAKPSRIAQSHPLRGLHDVSCRPCLEKGTAPAAAHHQQPLVPRLLAWILKHSRIGPEDFQHCFSCVRRQSLPGCVQFSCPKLPGAMAWRHDYPYFCNELGFSEEEAHVDTQFLKKMRA